MVTPDASVYSLIVFIVNVCNNLLLKLASLALKSPYLSLQLCLLLNQSCSPLPPTNSVPFGFNILPRNCILLKLASSHLGLS